MTFRLLVCGARRGSSLQLIDRWLGDYWTRYGERLAIASGMAPDPTGADRLAEAWAARHGAPFYGFPVDERIDGPWPGAGRRRNIRMFEGFRPDEVLALPGGPGTAHMKRYARSRGCRVVEVG